MSSEVLVALITSSQALFAMFGMALLQRYYAAKDKKKVHDVEKGIDNSVKLKERLELIREDIEAARVNVWVFHNGGYYYTGEPVQKISCISESNAIGFEPIMQNFQSTPIHLFIRNLEKLKDKEFFQEYNELQYGDDLSKINEKYKIYSNSIFKITNEKGKWVGVIMIGFHEHRELDEEEIDYVVSQINYIEENLVFNHQ